MAYSTINKSTDFFNTKLYTGNGSSQNISGLDFKPDFTWIKSRSLVKDHDLYDIVRGVDKPLESNTTGAEQDAGGQGLTSFRSDGFAIGNRSTINTNSATQVSWNWKANGAGSANTDGSTNSTVSANTTAGFSIVSFTGTDAAATIGHGLGAKPNLILVKSRTDGSYNWVGYHSSLGAGYKMTLNSSSDKGSTSNWGSTEPTSSVFSVNPGGGETNNLNSNFIAYCFAEKKGYSKFGSYTGNGNADGTFVYTGFKPAFVMTKKTSGTSSWDMHDTKRDTFNVATKHLLAEDTGAEGSTVVLDILSNGFKFRTSNGDRNASGASYIYMAFGQSIVGSNNIPATAR